MKPEHGYGALHEPTPVRNYKFELACGYQPRTDLPESYTISAATIPPIHDQGFTNACASFAMCAAAESEKLREGDGTHYSTGWNYGRRESRGNYEGEGLYMSKALSGAVKIGFVPEHYFTFTNDVPDILKLAAERDDLLPFGKKHKPASYVAFEYAYKDKLWDSIRAAFVTYDRPLVIYSAEYFGGGHAVIAYGFTTRNGTRYLKIQNSWGKNWCNGGRGEIPIEDVDGTYLFLWDEIKLPFADVKLRDWFYNDVKATYLSGLIQGKAENEFAPNDNIIRGDVAVILDRLLTAVEKSANVFGKSKQQVGETCGTVTFEKATETVKFTDVKPDDYYYDAVCRISANKIVDGKSYSVFAPTDAITRAEMAQIAVRTLYLIKSRLVAAFNKDCNLETTAANTFTDVVPNKWYINAIHAAAIHGIINGYRNGTFRPENPVTRAEAAAIFNRVFRAVDKLLQQLV